MADLIDSLCKRSGEDLGIIRSCGESGIRGIRGRFAMVGLVACWVGILSFVSCWYSFQMLFDDAGLAIPVALLFAWMIFNIYTVLLTTLSKPVLKFKNQGVIKHLSLSLRVGFIVFFAVFISKPLEAWFFEPQLAERVALMKEAAVDKASRQLEARIAPEEKKIQVEIRKKEALRYPGAAIQPLRDEIRQLHADNDEALERVRFVVGRADYFIQRIQILTGSGLFMLSWLFTLLVVVLFLLPVYLKRKLNEKNLYLLRKGEIYDQIVTSGYAAFKTEYRRILGVECHERYLDPPYNTEKKVPPHTYKSQDDFFERYPS